MSTENTPRKELRDGWTYEPSDFGFGWVLWEPGGNKYIMKPDGSPRLYPTVASMELLIRRVNGEIK